jgi:sugar phosphate isomerase/epimerase
MRIGFYTSTFNDRPIEEVLDFAVEAGFDAIELDVGGHVKTPGAVAPVVESARSRGLFVSSLALFGGQLNADTQAQVALRARTHEFAQAIGEAKVPIFVLFGGHNDSLSEADNYRDFAEHMQSLLAATEETRLDLAIENWPGPDNRFIASTPSGWERLFASVDDARLGLEFDPSHLIRLGIDPFRALEGVRDRVKILHAKDTSIDPAALQATGYHGAGWWRYRLPGSGSLDWQKFLSQARMFFDGTISIEHEDTDFGWPQNDLTARKAGERRALGFLRTTLGAL